MNTIEYKNNVFEKYISNENIIKRCRIIAQTINLEYHKEEIVFIGLLEGCLPFMSSILNFLDCKHTSSFLKVSSYKGFKSCEINLESDLEKKDLYRKNIIIVDDIIDTGKTIIYVKNYLENLQAKKIKIASLLVKDSSLKLSDWFGFKIKDAFVIGYGMDLDGEFRDLKDIYIRKL